MSTTQVSQAVLDRAQKLLEADEKKKADIKAHIAKTYPHALPDTLDYDPIKKKYFCSIECTVTGEIRPHVYTSDLFQVTTCVAEAEKAKKARKEAKKAELEAAKALLRDRKAQVSNTETKE